MRWRMSSSPGRRPAAATTIAAVSSRRGAARTWELPKSVPPCSAAFPPPAASAMRRKIRHHMTDVARRLARVRVPLGYALGVVALWLAAPTPRSLAAGAALGAVGEALRMWAAGHLEKGREVTRTGP